METLTLIKLIVGALIASWEVISRVVPTDSRWSIIGKILEIAKYLSDWFDNNQVKKAERQARRELKKSK